MSTACWTRIIQHATRLPLTWQPLRPDAGPSSDNQGDRQSVFLYGGNSHDPVPRALLLDKRLTPLERNAWLVIHLLAHEPEAPPPRYGDLEHYLSSVPGSASASRETIARVLSLLRLTRWLSRLPQERDAHTGQLQKAVYVLHGEPLSPSEALKRDPHYFELIGNSLQHAAKAVRLVAEQVLDELKQDPAVDLSHVPTSRARRALHPNKPARPGEAMLPHESEPGDMAQFGFVQDLVRNRATPSSESEPSLKSGTYGAVRNPNSPSTVHTNTSINICTVPHAQEEAALGFCLDGLDTFKLTPSAQRQVTQALISLAPAQRQAVLDEASARCRAGGIREPAAYLTALIQRARRGEFKLWAGASETSTAPTAKPPERPCPPQPKRQPGDPVSAQVQACLDELRLYRRSRPES
jgi:hypothetical protein